MPSIPGGRGLGHVGGGVVSLGTVFGGGSTQRTAVLAGMKENGTPPL